jgi:hypothetical protein
MNSYPCCTRIAAQNETGKGVTERSAQFFSSQENQQALLHPSFVTQKKEHRRQVLAGVQKRRKIIYQRYYTQMLKTSERLI